MSHSRATDSLNQRFLDNTVFNIKGKLASALLRRASAYAVRKAVYKMGEPCSPLLLSFYWDKLSWENIAVLLHYKDANSAKTQKYKCIQKLKAQFV